MLIDCPACSRSYHVSSGDIGVGGRTVICPRCEARWFVHGDGPGALVPLPSDLPAQAFSSRLAAAPAVQPPSPRFAWGPALSIGAAVLFAMAAIGSRDRVVRAIPRFAALYDSIGLTVNLRGLSLAAAIPARLQDAPVAVSGTIRNIASHRVAVPRLVYEVRDAAGVPLATWIERAPGRTLASEGAMPFVSTPHQLPAEARSVLIHFAADDELEPRVRVAAGAP
jgi:predicted Zn finger-like uncharacterized protein